MSSEKNKETVGKADIYLVPPEVIEAIAWIRMYGNKKYPEGGINNWKNVEIEKYYSAAMRHLMAWRQEEVYDQESGYPHLWHAACNIAFMVALETDERKSKNKLNTTATARTLVDAYLGVLE